MRYLFLSIIVVLLLVSCGYVQERENLKNCKFELNNVRVQNASLKGMDLVFDIGVENPNKGKVVIERFDYKAYSMKDLLVEGSSSVKKELNAGETGSVSISAKVDYKNLRTGLAEMLSSGKTKYTLMGTVYLSTFLGEIPFPFEIVKKP